MIFSVAQERCFLSSFKKKVGPKTLKIGIERAIALDTLLLFFLIHFLAGSRKRNHLEKLDRSFFIILESLKRRKVEGKRIRDLILRMIALDRCFLPKLHLV